MKRLSPILLAGLLVVAGLLPAPHAVAADKPVLKVQTLSGATFDLAAHRGKWVVVNYWATWCRPCIHEMPAISGFVKDHADVDAIGLAFQDADPADLKAFLSKHPVSYPVAKVDPVHPPSAFAAPLALPTTYLIAPDGSVAWSHVGPIKPADLEQAMGKGQ